MTAPPQRDWIVLLAISVTFCVAFLVEPDWNLQEAHRLCPGQPVQVFESITACSVNTPPACICERPLNPWVIVYWVVFLSGIGISASLLLRAPALRGASSLVVAMVAGGYGGIFVLSRRDLFEPEAWGYAPFVIAAYIAIALVAYGLATLARRLVAKRRLAN